MQASTIALHPESLASAGLSFHHELHYQCTPEELTAHTLRRGEGWLSDTGALVIHTGEFTGRSPKDKFIVRDALTAFTVNWNDFNIPLEPRYFEAIKQRIASYLDDLPELWVRDCYACADPRFRIGVRVINEQPSGNLFACNMFLRPDEDELAHFEADWTVLCAPGLHLDPRECGVRQHNAAVISFSEKMILIAGTGYTGEIKKGIFSVLNYLLPHEHGVLSMHCAANVGEYGDTALFFGLSGTGKTTLSTDPERRLIGDDEHGWSNNNVFNFEGGCYAKTIDLTEAREPEIYHAIRPGALVENTMFFEGTATIDFCSRTITENTRVSYPLDFIGNAEHPSIASTPAHIFFLTCDATGVLPPISRLTPAQAMYHFISGYTAKVAGTEAGVLKPAATFSACFGAPFMPLHPGRYAAMLGEKMRRNKVKVWLINTGWSGGAPGSGNRIPLRYTRAMVSAALAGQLDRVQYDRHPVFGVDVPASCPGVPDALLYPRDTWADKAAYDLAAEELAKKFINNFEKYASGVDAEVGAAGPAM